VTVPLTPQTADLPHALAGPVTRPFWEACSRGELIYQRCVACGTIAFPPTDLCRACLDARLEWETSVGTGRLYSWTIVWRPVTPAFTAPYAPAIVDVDEGYQMMTNLIGIAPNDITVGLPVRVSFHRVGSDLCLPYFEPA
jgi:uncharacterized OB-fold protein